MREQETETETETGDLETVRKEDRGVYKPGERDCDIVMSENVIEIFPSVEISITDSIWENRRYLPF